MASALPIRAASGATGRARWAAGDKYFDDSVEVDITIKQAPVDYGQGPVVACYVKDRAKPAMPGWTMMWKDGAARAKSCDNVLPACRDMQKKWGGSGVCCTMQGGDKKIAGKRAGTDACTE